MRSYSVPQTYMMNLCEDEVFHVDMLLLTNFHPVPTNLMSGVFITKRLEKISRYDINFDVFGMVPDENTLLKLSRVILSKPKTDLLKDINSFETSGIRYNYIHIPLGLFQTLSVRAKPSRLVKIYAKNLYQGIDIKKYDFVHAHGVYPMGYIACFTKNKYDLPCVLTAHGSEIHTLPYIRPKLKPIILKTLESADKVIFVSNALLSQSVELGYGGENAVVIPNGVDISSFYILDKNRTRKCYGIYEPDTHYVGFVGNLTPVKRVDKLPELFLNVKKEVPNVKFLIVGDGSLKDTIQKKFTANGLDVVFTGRVKPEVVSSWMNCMDCLILPSRNEGWGSVVLEAQACGVPVIGSNAGGIPEAVGEGGLIVEEGDDFEERFAEAVCSVLCNPPNPEKLRKRAQEYDWEKTVQKEVEVYRSLIR